MPLIKENQQILLQVAKQSIEYGFNNKLIAINLDEHPLELHKQTATFVTLEINGNLRGCIGTLIPIRPLIMDIAYHAYAAAFSDPRFAKVCPDEFHKLEVYISLLSIPEFIYFDSEEDLIQQLRPKIDGLILTDGVHKGTFLPSVWDSLNQPSEFLRYLKQKAGLTPDYWSNKITIERYTVEYIS